MTRKERNAAAFIRAITAAKRAHPYGAAVEVKDPITYATARLFLAHDGLTGAAVTRTGDLISVFRHPDSPTHIDPILRAAAPHARTLDGFDIGGKLPDLYARYGFYPVARMAFNPEYAPTDWDYARLGRPDVVFMVKTSRLTLSVPYATIRSTVPLVSSWNEAQAAQAAALEA